MNGSETRASHLAQIGKARCPPHPAVHAGRAERRVWASTPADRPPAGRRQGSTLNGLSRVCTIRSPGRALIRPTRLRRWQSNTEDHYVLRANDLGRMSYTGDVLNNNHTTHRKAPNLAAPGRNLVLALRRHQDHATRCYVRRVVLPAVWRANPEAPLGSQEWG